MIDIQFTSFISEIIVFDVFVLFFLFWFWNISGLFEGLLVCERLSPQVKLSIWSQLFYNNLPFLIQNTASSFHIDLKDIQEYFLIFCNTPTNNYLHGLIDLNASWSIVHQKEVIDQISQFLKLLIRLPQVALEYDERLDVEWDLTICDDVLDGGHVYYSKLDHVQYFMLICSSHHKIAWPLFTVRTEQKQWSI